MNKTVQHRELVVMWNKRK